jgi:hypothetical protein
VPNLRGLVGFLWKVSDGSGETSQDFVFVVAVKKADCEVKIFGANRVHGKIFDYTYDIATKHSFHLEAKRHLPDLLMPRLLEPTP